ncbi:MAG: hypothetical protein ACTIAO_04000, partial [Microbacterium sp.]
PDVERAEGETKRAERAERAEASPEAPTPEADDRPLPGLSDLAAVASMFANPVGEPNSAAAGIESAEAEEDADAAEEADADAETAEETADSDR